MPDGALIPKIIDNVANHANSAAIDALLKTLKYGHIVAWGKWLGFTPEAVLKYVQDADADDAPADAIQKIDGQWLRLGDIHNESNRRQVDEMALGRPLSKTRGRSRSE